MNRTDHRAAWDARYAADYPTTQARDAAYREHQETLELMDAVFSPAGSA